MKTTFKCLNRDQRGITLIEMLVVVALFGILAAGILATISQVLTVNARTSSNMVALRQVQQAGDSVSRDVLQALPFKVNSEPGFPLTLAIPYYTDSGEPKEHTVEYEWDSDGRLVRTYKDGESGTDVTTIVARYIDDINIEERGTGYLLTVIASVPGGRPQTREYEIKPRVGS